MRLNSIGVRVSKEINFLVWGILDLTSWFNLSYETTKTTTPITTAHSKPSSTAIIVVSFFFFYLSSVSTRSNSGSGLADMRVFVYFCDEKLKTLVLSFWLVAFWMI